MSMLSACTMGAMASKKASASAPVAARMLSARGALVSGPVAMIQRPSAGSSVTSLIFDENQRVGAQAFGHGPGEGVAVDGQGAAGRQAVPLRHFHHQAAGRAHFPMDQAHGIAFVVVRPEGVRADHFGKSPVRCAKVPTLGRISCSTTGTPAFAAAQAASDPAMPPPMM
jgi:hypothetical protein